MLSTSKQTIAALFLGVFILMISGCESNVPTQSVDESETLQEAMEDFSNLTDEESTRKPGQLDPDKLTDVIREIIKASGEDPDNLRFGELSEKGYSLKGEEAWEKYMKNWDPKEGFGEKSQLMVNPGSTIFSSSVIPPSPAETAFIVSGISNPPADGSITVKYQGEQVTSYYSMHQPASTVAYSVSSDINNDPDIQLTATVPSSGIVLVTEKRDGCEYNGNSVYVSHTNGTHVTVNNSSFLMAGGTDETGCHEEVPLPPDEPDDPPISIYVSWGSVIYTPCCINYGWVDMWSYTWASQSLYYLDVIAASRRDGFVIGSGQDGGYNESYAIVGTSEYKDPLDDTSTWWQGGNHLIAPSSAYGWEVESWDLTTF